MSDLPSRAELANHLDLSRNGAQDLIAKGVLPKAGTLDEYRVIYLRHLRGRASGHSNELMDERQRLAKEQADRIAMENAETRVEIARWVDVESFLLPLFSGVVQRLRAVPAKAAPEAHGAATIATGEAIYRRHQDEALAELATLLAGGTPGLRRRVAGEGAERRRRARQRAAPAEPEDGERVGGSAATGAGRDKPRAGDLEK